MKKYICYGLAVTVIGLLSLQPVWAVDRFQIQPAESLPETTPWHLESLSHPPAFEWADGNEVRSLYYTGEPYQGKSTRVFAYYATPGSLSGDPSLDKDLPAMVLVHGGGGRAFDQWVKLWASRGYAAIAMDLAGCGPDKARLADGGPDQSDTTKFGAIDQPITNQWTYHAVANVILGHSLMRSFPEVDPDRTALTGISWGGYLTCIVAGLDNRFAAAVPVYGCGFLHENSCWLPQFAKMSPENKARWVKLWDPSHYVGSAAMPMLFVNGGKDFAYPPDSFAKTYGLVQSPTTIRFSPDLPHGHIFDRPKAIEVFIEHHLNHGMPLARISPVEVTPDQVTAHVDTDTPLVSAYLYYTLDTLTGDPKQRQWIQMPATIQQDRILAKRPPENSATWFLTVTDDRDTQVASPLVFSKPRASRWSLGTQGDIVWNLSSPADLPHKDHMAMSGRLVDMILEWEIDADKQVSAKRLIRWPMLRTLPDDTHASLQRRLSGPDSPVVFIEGQALSPGSVTQTAIHGTLEITTDHAEGLTQTRTIYPCVHSPAVIDLCQLTNRAKNSLTVHIIPWKTLEKTDPNEGHFGSYVIEQFLIGQTQQVLAPGETLTYALVHDARMAEEAPYFGEPAAELAARQRFIETLEESLILNSPDARLNRLFAFSKLRSAESIFSTRGGLMHGPGGYNKYLAAIWANDQAEYVNPFFPFLGLDAGNESALNSYRHFARYMNPQYERIPSSIIAEGRGMWNGARDRGDMAMIAYGASRFALASGNAQWGQELWTLIAWCLEYCDRQRTAEGVIASDSDELEGRFPAGKANLCTSTLYYDALRSSADLGRALSKDPAQLDTYRSQAQALLTAIKDYFEATIEGFDTYRYYKENTVLRSWICMPLCMGIYDRSEGTIDALFSPRLWTADGLLTKAGTTTVWDRSTLYAMRGILAKDASPGAMEKLTAFSTRRLLGDHVPYVIEAFPEQNQSHLSAESGLYCRIFTEGLFGIRPTGLQQFTCTPQLPKDWPTMSLQRIRAFGHTWNLGITRDGANLKVRVSNTANQTLYEQSLPAGSCHRVDLAKTEDHP